MSAAIDRLDREFSLLVRTLANWKCARCGGDFSGNRDMLQCSHFHSRRNRATRFHLDNCSALCWQCHWYLDHHPTAHKVWKVMQIGEKRYEALARRVGQIVKLDLKDIREWMRSEMRLEAAKHETAM